MNGNILTYQGRLEIVFRLKLELLRDIIFGKYKTSPRDIINLVSYLIEIIRTARAIELREKIFDMSLFPSLKQKRKEAVRIL